MSSARFLRLAASRRLVSLLRRGAPTTAAVHPAAPPQYAHPHVFPGATFPSQRPILWSVSRWIASNSTAEETAVPRSVCVTVAYDLLKSGYRYLDVRTAEEFSGGHVLGAVNIPYMLNSASGVMLKNPDFIQEVSSIFKKDDKIIIGCRSGKRSLMAASDLLNAGFNGVKDVAGGYSYWLENKLPTEQGLELQQTKCT